MRNYNLLLLFTFIIFCWNCADNLGMDEVEQTAAEAIIMSLHHLLEIILIRCE